MSTVQIAAFPNCCCPGDFRSWLTLLALASAFRYFPAAMVIDDDSLTELLQINDDLLQLCKWLNEKRDMATSSRLIPLVDDLTRILTEAGKNKLHYAAIQGILHRG
jgi:hypothetical protein